jgi:hypothetical protein
MSKNADILPCHSEHPGWDAEDCPLRITVTASRYGTSSDGFACSMSGGHCLPSEVCAKWAIGDEHETL